MNTGSLLSVALACRAANISVVPAAEDGTKRPDIPWADYQTRLPTELETRIWFQNGRTGIGAVTGAVSGNLEALDFDNWDTFVELVDLARASGSGELLDRLLNGYQERSPRGAHLLYRCDELAGNQKLASVYQRDEEGHVRYDERGKPLIATLIETRGEGGFCIIAPSHGKVHPSGKPYVLERGSIATILTITPQERADLFIFARAFHEVSTTERTRQEQQGGGTGNRPGDIYNVRATWEGYWSRTAGEKSIHTVRRITGEDPAKIAG